MIKCKYQYGYLHNSKKKRCLINNRLCYRVKDCPMKKLSFIATHLNEFLLDNEIFHITKCIERIGLIEYE